MDTHHLEFSKRFVAAHQNNRRYWAAKGLWMQWERGSGWTESHKQLNDMALTIKAAIPSNTRSQWLRVPHFKNSLKLAAEQLCHDEWDVDPALLGLPGGRVEDLRSGRERPQKHEDWITMAAGCSRVADIPSPLWEKLVLDTCGGDQEMADSLQLTIGASTFGHNRNHRVEILCGDGGTGKTTFADTVSTALGTYAGALAASVLNSRADQHPTGIAALVGKRFVTVPEVVGGTFKAETLKSISGGDTIPARFMRQNFFLFRPVSTLWLMTNEPPAVRLVDNALRRRIRIWPFESKPAVPDPNLPERLRSPDVLDGVLRWIVDGAALYSRWEEPFPDCRAVREATAQYFEATDSIGAWFNTCCKVSTTAVTPARDLFKKYAGWCEVEGARAVSQTAWGTWMGRRAEKRRAKAGKFYTVVLDDV